MVGDPRLRAWRQRYRSAWPADIHNTGLGRYPKPREKFKDDSPKNPRHYRKEEWIARNADPGDARAYARALFRLRNDR